MAVIKTKQKGEPVSAFENSIAIGNTGYLGGKPASEYVLKSTEIEATLLAANWVDGVYTLTVTGVTATSNQELLPSLAITADELTALQTANIQDNGQSADTVVLKAFGDIPTIDIPIRVIMRGDS